MVTPMGPPLELAGAEKLQQYRLHSGLTPIAGPVKDEEIEKVLESLKEKEPVGVQYLVFEGTFH